MTPLFEVRNATKRFGNNHALHGVSFEVYPGEVLAVVGQAGAGKSTLLRAMRGAVRLSDGYIAFRGRDVSAVGGVVRVHIGSVPDDSEPDDTVFNPRSNVAYATWNPTACEHLVRVSQQYGLNLRHRVHALCDQIWLHPDTLVREMSPVELQKLAIVQAFMHLPDALLLDEPTKHLDAAARHEVDQLVHDARQRGAGVVLASSLREEIVPIADRVAVLRRGHLVGIGGYTSQNGNDGYTNSAALNPNTSKGP
jgi:ABC-type multidrug transport system ATPase subunit